jgi:hypothetical protein
MVPMQVPGVKPCFQLVLGPPPRTNVQYESATRSMTCCRLVDESQEQWEDLHGPQAVLARLRAIETRLEQLRAEVGVVGQWADHPASPDLKAPLKRVRELLQDAARQVRQERQRRQYRGGGKGPSSLRGG